ncbi:hypothetical protein CsSME_00021282 [Camellia sinensis var. sinensis]
MEIPEEVVSPTHGHDTNLKANFAYMWERDWDTGLQQRTPEGSEPPMPVVRRDGVIPPNYSPETHLVVSDVLSGLDQALVDSVGELEIMWHQWEGQLSSMGIRPGQLVTERVGELTASPRQEQQHYSGSINDPDQGPLLASTEDVLRAIHLNGPSPRLNLTMGEAPIITRAFIRESPSSWTKMGSVTYEVGQSSSMIDSGPQDSAVVAVISSSIPSISTLSRPTIRKRLREMDLGFDLLYDTEPMLVTDKVRGPLQDCSNEMLMHSSGIVSDSVCPPQSLSSLLRKHLSRQKKARYSIPSVMHANAVSWPIRKESARFSSLRRRRKLRFRSHHLLAAPGSSLGSTSWRRRGQSSRPSSGSQRGYSVTMGCPAQDTITSESGYDTGVSSPEARGLCYKVPQVCSPLDLDQVHHQTSRFMAMVLDPSLGLTRRVSQEVVPQQPPHSP